MKDIPANHGYDHYIITGYSIIILFFPGMEFGVKSSQSFWNISRVPISVIYSMLHRKAISSVCIPLTTPTMAVVGLFFLIEMEYQRSPSPPEQTCNSHLRTLNNEGQLERYQHHVERVMECYWSAVRSKRWFIPHATRNSMDYKDDKDEELVSPGGLWQKAGRHTWQ